MATLNVVILAAGKGERMRSGRPKVMHQVMGKPMVGYAVERALELNPERVVAVIGHGREEVEAFLCTYGIQAVVQEEQKGTAHAVLTAGPFLATGDLLVLYGDVPLMKKATLETFLASALASKRITFMTTDLENPSGYGRVKTDGRVIEEIIEDADATQQEKAIKTINTGICVIPGELFHLLKEVKPVNRKGEYYLTDIVKIAGQKGKVVEAFHHANSSEVLGINTRKELLEANMIMKERILDAHLQRGVTLLDRNIYIESAVTIGRDTVIFPECYLMGETAIGENVSIGPHTVLKSSKIKDNVAIEGFVMIEGAEVEEGARIGPFTRVRGATRIGRNVKVGSFVEVKNSVLKLGAAANHLAYIGDTEVGQNVNIGAGTVTCNYDGKKKHRTVIGDNAFIGSNTELVAPVTIGKDSVVGAGSTITRDVPDDTLAITRAPQRHIPGQGRKKRCAE
jgi:bifunctional UDP-N-acetylglucosamine pyrophosphorylase/glucosamine-1-phosphate N-acetyltransferase